MYHQMIDTTCAHVTNVSVASEIPVMEETVLGDITLDIVVSVLGHLSLL